MSIIDLLETAPNNWRAKYQGNYGIYTIKIATDGKRTTRFSCSCPSDYYPCKHIPMVEKAIRELVSTINLPTGEAKIDIEEILKKVLPDELRKFIARLAKHNPELTNTILLEFSHKQEIKKEINNYSLIIRSGLGKLNLDYEDLYDYEGNIDINILDQWLDKARQYAMHGNHEQAILICKACIEEYAEWLQTQDSDVVDYISEEYAIAPFDILCEIIPDLGIGGKALFDYCKDEMNKDKYVDMRDAFNEMLLALAHHADPNEFIFLLDQQLSDIPDNASRDAESILTKKICFYTQNNQSEKAWDIINTNIQIETFRKEVVKKRIEETNFAEAKTLINTFISSKGSSFYRDDWNILLLDIARKENDIPAIRKIAFAFIKDYFKQEYYLIYKAAFCADEWPGEMEKLIRHYQEGKRWFCHSAADVLVAEGLGERLMAYINQYLSVEILEKYYIHFPSAEKTLNMFRQAIDSYAENTGRTYYMKIAELMKRMKKIRGGTVVVNEMIVRYKSLYKNRRAMMEVLNRIG